MRSLIVAVNIMLDFILLYVNLTTKCFTFVAFIDLQFYICCNLLIPTCFTKFYSKAFICFFRLKIISIGNAKHAQIFASSKKTCTYLVVYKVPFLFFSLIYIFVFYFLFLVFSPSPFPSPST